MNVRVIITAPFSGYAPGEAATMAESLEGYEKKAAKDRQGQRADKHPVNFTGSSNGAAADKVADVVETEPGIADAWVNHRFCAMYLEQARKILAKVDEAEEAEKSKEPA